MKQKNMRKYIYTIIIAALLVTGCKDTNVNLVQDRGDAVVPTMSDPIPAYFTDDIDASYVQFDLSLPPGETVDKAEIEVTRGDSISAILEDITLPVTGLKITAAEVIQALNIKDYQTGDIYTLYVLTTKDGKTTRSTASFTIPVNCYFDPSMLTGNFNYNSDDWGISGSVTITADPTNPYIVYINQDGIIQGEGLSNGNGNPIELDVNPNNFKITGPKTIIAPDLSDFGLPYTNYSYTPITGSYSACDDAYNITFDIAVDQGDFGNNGFTFTRK